MKPFNRENATNCKRREQGGARTNVTISPLIHLGGLCDVLSERFLPSSINPHSPCISCSTDTRARRRASYFLKEERGTNHVSPSNRHGQFHRRRPGSADRFSQQRPERLAATERAELRARIRTAVRLAGPGQRAAHGQDPGQP